MGNMTFGRLSALALVSGGLAFLVTSKALHRPSETEVLNARVDAALDQWDATRSQGGSGSHREAAGIGAEFREQLQKADDTTRKLEQISGAIHEAQIDFRQAQSDTEHVATVRKSLQGPDGKPRIDSQERKERLDQALQEERAIATRRQTVIKALEQKLQPLFGS